MHRLDVVLPAAQAAWKRRQVRWGAHGARGGAPCTLLLPPLPLARCAWAGQTLEDSLQRCLDLGQHRHSSRPKVGRLPLVSHPLLGLLLDNRSAYILSPQLLPNLTVSLVKTYQGCSSGSGEIVVAAVPLIADWRSWVAQFCSGIPSALLLQVFRLAGASKWLPATRITSLVCQAAIATTTSNTSSSEFSRPPSIPCPTLSQPSGIHQSWRHAAC